MAVRHISLPEFEKALDFLERSGIDQARLLGGEPTLHPDFPELVDRALRRNLRLLVFSNGLMPAPALRRLSDTAVDRVAVLLNATGYPAQPPRLRRRQAAAMARLGRRVTLGVNIHAPAFEPGFLLDLIREYGLSPCIRVGLAHPCVGGTNRYLHPRYYLAAGRRLAGFAEQARGADVELAFDCGFVPCMFPPGAWESFSKHSFGIGPGCNPLPDLLPDGRMVCCYPLAALRHEALEGAGDAASVRARLGAQLAPLRGLGVFRECAKCELRERGECAGGCMAAALLRLRRPLQKGNGRNGLVAFYSGGRGP
jgi:hypothetical protein